MNFFYFILIKLMDIFQLLLIFILIIISKGCQDNEILKNNITCISIETLINNPNEELDFLNINFLTQEIKSISKNGYDIDFIKLDNNYLQSKNISQSKIYISEECMNLIKDNFNVDISTGMVMIISNNNKLNPNGLPERYFVIRFSGSGLYKYLNSSTYNFSICNNNPILLNMSINMNEIKAYKKKEKEKPNEPDIYEETNINIERVLYAKNVNVDLFDPHSDFLEDICFKFKSEKNTDVTLETRLLDYYQNVTLCDNTLNAHYMSFNYSEIENTLYYCCAYGYYKDEKDKMTYIDKLDAKMNIVFTNSNFKVINCYKELLNNKNILNNIGELICIFVLIMQIIFFLTFFFEGTSPLKKQIKKLIRKAPKVSPLQYQIQEKNYNSEREQIDNNLNENNNNIPSNNIPANYIPNNKIPNNINNSIDNQNNTCINNSSINNIQPNNNCEHNTNLNQINLEFPQDNSSNKINKEANSPNKNNKINENIKIKNRELNPNNEENFETNLENGQNIPDEQDKNTNISEENIDNKDNIKKETKKEKRKRKEQIKIEKIMKKRNSRIFEYDDDDLNELSFDAAKLFDKRHFCKYYCFMIKLDHIIINTFCRCGDYNLFTVKLGLLLFLFPLNLTFNAFFFTSKEIKSVYIYKLSDISVNWKNLVRSFSSSIFSSIIFIFLKLLCLTHNSIRQVKKNKSIEGTKKQSVRILRCATFRIFLYYLFSFIFLIIFGFYVSCFCAIFENTQLLLIETMIISWFLSLVYPFIICFLTTIFRRGSLTCGKRGISCCYRINKILQLI